MPRFGSRLHEGAAVGEARAVTASEAPDLVLTRGRVYTMDAARSWADAVAVRAGGSQRSVRAQRSRHPAGPRRTSSICMVACSCPASRTLICIRRAAASRRSSATCTGPRPGSKASSALRATRRHIPTRNWILGEAGDGRLPRRDPVERRPGRDPSRPAGLPHEPGRARRLGELEGARAGGHLTRDRRPEGRTDRA